MSRNQRVSARVCLNEQGRIVIPAQFRRALGMKPGEELIVWLEDDRLIIETRDGVEQRLLSRFAHIRSGVSVVDELLSERREAARLENEEMAEWLKSKSLESS